MWVGVTEQMRTREKLKQAGRSEVWVSMGRCGCQTCVVPWARDSLSLHPNCESKARTFPRTLTFFHPTVESVSPEVQVDSDKRNSSWKQHRKNT